ncbi:haloacid dehalogenase type II [Sinomonas halotolerans]|uniref:Haloacid dehalogenase type II n=1 Tax=Sinomonas halotolerans TaxID=1644133 RepID=A0ABU9WYU2_9MICC
MPDVIVFDVNETLSDMSGLGPRFVEAGAPAELAKLWFAMVLREGFALAAAGDSARFSDLATEILASLLREAGVADEEATASRLTSSIADLPLHRDAAEGIHALRAAGHRLVTLSNGSSQVVERLVGAAGIQDQFERILSVEDAPAWKPHRDAYRHAAAECGVGPEEMLLVAVHPWDIHGAARAGLQTAWVNRSGAAYPPYFARPDLTLTSLGGLVRALHPGP